MSSADGLGHGLGDITSRPPLDGTVPVDSDTSSSSNNRATNGSAANANDVSGVLRRNQACLACRRRKLKCDATRPHCSTCVRSYRHLMRTAPSTNPTLSCEYDDGEKDHERGGSNEAEDEAEGGRKKKRKTSGGRKKTRDADGDEERETLMKRVAALEHELATKSASVSGGSVSSVSGWNSLGQQASLSNAFSGSSQSSSVQQMWTSRDRSESLAGLSPFTTQLDPTMGGFGTMDGPQISPAPAMLSPNNIFNFSPAPTGPAATLQWTGPDTTPQAPITGDAGWGIDSLISRQGSGDEAINDIRRAADLASVGDGIDTTGLDDRMLLELFWPGWPPNLPEPSVVQHLIESFFEVVPNMPRLVNRGRFFARMQLPPTHSDFPHPSLLHAICALSASWGNNVEVDAPAVDGRSGGKITMSQQQASYAKVAVQDGLNTGNRLMDVVRAMIILTRVFIDDTRMVECWTYCGLVSRMILPLGLNVRSAELSLKSVMLPPPSDPLEREERRIVVWMSMYHDTVASAASGWGSSMSLDELTVPLPASKADFGSGSTEMDSNPQDIESLDLFIKHPVVDPFVMALKGSILLYRVNKFARKWKNRRLRDGDDMDGMQRPEFREYANALACLQMTFPPTLQDATLLNDKKQLDVDLISAHLIPQMAVICLYEMFADVTDPKDQAAIRIINAARSIIRLVQHVMAVCPNGAVNLAAVMHSSSSVSLVTAARTCLLFYRHALNVGDTMLAEGYRADIETARMALSRYGQKFKIGFHHSKLIEYFLDRATSPSYNNLISHYPDHPRPGALPLTPQSHLGVAILTALNIKRGFWKATVETHGSAQQQQLAGRVSNGSTPGSQNSALGNGSKNVPELTANGSTTMSSASTDFEMPSPFVGTAWNRADQPLEHDASMDLTHFSALKFLDFGSGRPKPSMSSTSPSVNAESLVFPESQ